MEESSSMWAGSIFEWENPRYIFDSFVRHRIRKKTYAIPKGFFLPGWWSLREIWSASISFRENDLDERNNWGMISFDAYNFVKWFL